MDDMDFDANLLAAAAEREGGEALRAVLDRLPHVADGSGERGDFVGAAGGGGGTDGSGAGFGLGAQSEAELLTELSRHTEKSVGMAADELASQEQDVYLEACDEWKFGTCSGFPDGHFFDSKRRGFSAVDPKALMKEMKRIRKMLPDPHPDGALFVVSICPTPTPALTHALALTLAIAIAIAYAYAYALALALT